MWHIKKIIRFQDKMYYISAKKGIVKMDILKNKIFVDNRIYELREKKNISARRLSLSLGMNSGYINKIENGRTMPSLDMLFEICTYFDITSLDFFNNN